MLRLAGRGLPRFEAPGTGDLYVKIAVHIPERISDQEREIYEQLRALTTQPSDVGPTGPSHGGASPHRRRRLGRRKPRVPEEVG